MNPTIGEMRQLAAEWMGWKPTNNGWGIRPDGKDCEVMPTYANSLEACRELELKGRYEHQFFFLEYMHNLTLAVCDRPYHQEMDRYGSLSSFDCITSTAPQRLEAWCRTIHPERFV